MRQKIYNFKIRLQDRAALETMKAIRENKATNKTFVLYGDDINSRACLVDLIRDGVVPFSKSMSINSIKEAHILLIEGDLSIDEWSFILENREKSTGFTVFSVNKYPSEVKNSDIEAFEIALPTLLTRRTLVDELFKMGFYEPDLVIALDVADKEKTVEGILNSAELRMERKRRHNFSNSNENMPTSTFILLHLPSFIFYTALIGLASYVTSLINPLPLILILGLVNVFMVLIERGRSENKLTVVLNAAISTSVTFFVTLIMFILKT